MGAASGEGCRNTTSTAEAWLWHWLWHWASGRGAQVVVDTRQELLAVKGQACRRCICHHKTLKICNHLTFTFKRHRPQSTDHRPQWSVVSPLAGVAHSSLHYTGWLRIGVTRQIPHPSPIFRSHRPPILPPPSLSIVRVEVGRDRHAQKAGCGGRAVAIDSAAVTRAQIPI